MDRLDFDNAIRQLTDKYRADLEALERVRDMMIGDGGKAPDYRPQPRKPRLAGQPTAVLREPMMKAMRSMQVFTLADVFDCVQLAIPDVRYSGVVHQFEKMIREGIIECQDRHSRRKNGKPAKHYRLKVPATATEPPSNGVLAEAS